MAVPSLPAQGSTNWYPWAQGVHTAATAVDSGRLTSITNAPKLLPLRRALATADADRANILIIGDSQTEGEGVTSVDKRFATRLPAALRARLGLPAGGRGYFAPVDTGQATYVYPAALAGGAINVDQGAKAQGIAFSSSAGGTTYSVHGTSVDLMDVTYGGGGSYTVTVDGGAPQTISTNAAENNGRLTRVNLGASGAHTVAVRGVGDGAVYHLGLIEYDGDETAGVTVHDGGHFGWTAAAWNTNMAPGRIGQAINALAPDAVVIALGHNEANQNITATSFRSSLTALIANVRAAITDPNPPILLLGYPADAEAVVPWQPYLDAMASIADSDAEVTFLDLSRAVPDHSVPGLYADPTHGNDKWHAQIAQVLADYLTPIPVPEFGTGSGGPGATGPHAAVSGRLFHSAPVITTTGPGPTMVPFDHTEYLLGGMTRSGDGLAAPMTGLYDVNAVGWFLGGNEGSRILIVYVNGSAQRQFSGYIANGGAAELRLSGADKLFLTGGDVVTLGVYKTGPEGEWRLHSVGDPMDIGLALTLAGV